MTSNGSSIDPSIPLVKPAYSVSPGAARKEPPALQQLISHLKLQPHIEGGYFVETDRDTHKVPNPFTPTSSTARQPHQSSAEDTDDTTRNASTTIHYLLTPASPQGHFHRNKARTVHTLHSGRGRYVIIHADEAGGKDISVVRFETFVVGHDVTKGERLQWIVEGGKYKASYLLGDKDGEEGSRGLLISETVVPGFDYKDHDFLTKERFAELVTDERQREELEWLVRTE